MEPKGKSFTKNISTFFQTFSINMNFMKKCFKMLIMTFKYQHFCLLQKSDATYYHFSKHEKESILLAFKSIDCQLGNTLRIVPNFWGSAPQ